MKNFLTQFGIIIFSLVIFSQLNGLVLADNSTVVYPGIPKPTGEDGKTIIPGQETKQGEDPAEIHNYFLETFIPYFTKGFSGVIGALCIVFLVIGGIQYLTSYGNDEAIQTAKRTITWACIGLMISILAYAIVSIITNLPLPQGNPPS